MPGIRQCSKCLAFLPSIASDPHEICTRCRGVKCSYDGPKCDFCQSWTKSKWDSFIPVARAYQSRSIASRSKRPGKPTPKVKATTTRLLPTKSSEVDFAGFGVSQNEPQNSLKRKAIQSHITVDRATKRFLFEMPGSSRS